MKCSSVTSQVKTMPTVQVPVQVLSLSLWNAWTTSSKWV